LAVFGAKHFWAMCLINIALFSCALLHLTHEIFFLVPIIFKIKLEIPGKMVKDTIGLCINDATCKIKYTNLKSNIFLFFPANFEPCERKLLYGFVVRGN
jgi:hypothetical protein